MIKVENDKSIIEGNVIELATEVALVLNQFYENAKRISGQKAADALLVEIGRLAVDTEKMKGVLKP